MFGVSCSRVALAMVRTAPVSGNNVRPFAMPRRITWVVSAFTALVIMGGACRSTETRNELRGAAFFGQLALPGIDVFVAREGESDETKIVTDVQGKFVLSHLPAGTYLVQPRMSGFEKVERIKVHLPQDRPVTFAMRPSPSGTIIGGAEPLDMPTPRPRPD